MSKSYMIELTKHDLEVVKDLQEYFGVHTLGHLLRRGVAVLRLVKDAGLKSIIIGDKEYILDQ